MAYYNLPPWLRRLGMVEIQERPQGRLIVGLNGTLSALNKRHPLLTFTHQPGEVLLAPPFGLAGLADLVPTEEGRRWTRGRACREFQTGREQGGDRVRGGEGQRGGEQLREVAGGSCRRCGGTLSGSAQSGRMATG